MGFQYVPNELAQSPDVRLMLKRQTWNTNRAVVMACPPAPPHDFENYLLDLRKRTADACRFIPILWPIGIQAVIVADGLNGLPIDPSKYVARIDTQWALIQSIFLVDPASRNYRAARTWGQVITGKYQDAIESVLAGHFARI